ncbi:MAG: heparinase II/III family protein [Mangrovibacterium sp.]|nr:heparinase II/III family protein [Mangrovibacterium sp.]
MFDYLNLLKTCTNRKIDIFDQELIRNMGRYIARAYVSNGNYYINFADAPFRISQDGGKIYRYGESIGDHMLTGFGAFLLDKARFNENGMIGKIGETLENLFNLEGWESHQKKEPLLADFYFPDMDVAFAREKAGSSDGFYFAAKGGSNGEGHNHNDVGSFMLFYQGNPVLIDVGVGTYTKKTFSPQRYEIWTMQSEYHNLPVVNGFSQSPGGKFKARNSQYSAGKNKVSFSTDIALAYPPHAGISSWTRAYALERGKKFVISDVFRLTENNGNNRIHFMTCVPCRVVSPGIMQFNGSDFTLQMKYDPGQMTAGIEKVNLDDKRLQAIFGDHLFRVAFVLKGTRLSDRVSFEVTPIR